MTNIIKSHGDLSDKRKKMEYWIDLDKVCKIGKDDDLQNKTYDIKIYLMGGAQLEEFEKEEERNERFKFIFEKWSGRTYLEEVK